MRKPKGLSKMALFTEFLFEGERWKLIGKGYVTRTRAMRDRDNCVTEACVVKLYKLYYVIRKVETSNKVAYYSEFDANYYAVGEIDGDVIYQKRPKVYDDDD